MMLNIPSHIKDPYYRYKMPSLRIKYEGSGNMTRILNLDDISQSLRVPPDYILKYIGYDFSCKILSKDFLLKGKYDESKLRAILDKFIEKYVLCPKCGLPEKYITVKGQEIIGNCNACGGVSNIKTTHKLNSYIIKNPPKNLSDFKFRESDNYTHSSHHQKKDSDDDDDSDEERKVEILKQSEDVSQEKLYSPILDFKDDEENLIKKVHAVYQHHLKGSEELKNELNDMDSFLQEVKGVIPSKYLDKAAYIVFNSVFDVNITKNIEKNKTLLTEVYKVFKPSLGAENDILLNLEVFLLKKNASVGFEKYIPTILQIFWKEELLSEEVLLSWNEGKLRAKFMMDFRYEKNLDEKFKEAAMPFIEWLE